jgi:predicted LPLAT superfamily acyltransferase
VSVVLVHAIVLYYFVTMPGARRASRAYLRRIAVRPRGARSLGRPPDRLASFLHFRAFALSIFDRIELWFRKEDVFRFRVSGREHFDRLLSRQRGGIVVGAHLGSFDALRVLSRQDGRAVNVVMYTRHAPRINAFFEQLSPEARLRVIPADGRAMDTIVQIRSCIARGELVAILGDRLATGTGAATGGGGRSCRVSFLGEPVDLPTAPYWLASILETPLFFMVALREEARRYHVSAEVLSERVELPRKERERGIQALAQDYAHRLEHYCERAPYQWFNFFDYWHDEP